MSSPRGEHVTRYAVTSPRRSVSPDKHPVRCHHIVGTHLSLPPSEREGDHEVVEGACVRFKNISYSSLRVLPQSRVRSTAPSRREPNIAAPLAGKAWCHAGRRMSSATPSTPICRFAAIAGRRSLQIAYSRDVGGNGDVPHGPSGTPVPTMFANSSIVTD